MAQPQPHHGLSKQTPTVLIPEILSFSPHFLLDDTVNIANDGVGRAVDAMEDFLNRWAETRLEREPDWDADKELEQGLVSFQTLLEFHADIAFDFFEAWSLRNIFAVNPDLPLVAPHHAGLNLDIVLDNPPEKEAELLAEIDELRRSIENQKHLRKLLTKAVRASKRDANRAQSRLDRLSFLHPDRLSTLRALATDVDALHAGVSALPPLGPATSIAANESADGKRLWEVGKAGYLSWASAQLVQRARAVPGGSASGGALAEEAVTAFISSSKENVAAALRELEREE